MEIKYTPQGFLIYASMAIYFLAFFFTLIKYRKTGLNLYVIGFIAALCSFAYRWHHVNHIPMQNLFEVFLCLGMLYPVSLFCDKILRVEGYAADMLIGVIVLFPAGFVFNAEPQQLPPALQSWLFAPHVAVYMLSYIFMAKAAFWAIAHLAIVKNTHQTIVNQEIAAYKMVCAGFPLLTLGLILGSYWGQCAWVDFWGWDPKELWSLASWLLYVGYFHFRSMYGTKYSRINSIWVILGLVLILITLLWVNLSRLFQGLHSYAA
jgi:ABC-type transport system involved in cytochrome c biogenesis permease subunit